MKEHPILCSTPVVQAILEGRQTQDRRPIKRQNDMEFDSRDPHYGPYWLGYAREDESKVVRPFGEVGDQLWVREKWAYVPTTAYRCSEGVAQLVNPNDSDMCAVYAAGWERCAPSNWRPSIHMPRWASRITLEVTGVRVERLQLISEEDAMAEGVQSMSYSWPANTPTSKARDIGPYRNGFRNLWASIYGIKSWDANPWVWVTEFRATP